MGGGSSPRPQAERTRTSTGFQATCFSQYCRKSLDNISRYSLRDFLYLEKSRCLKTAKHLSVSNFCSIFGANDAALLTQGKEAKAKSGKKGH